MGEEDARRIVEFHSSDYTRDWEHSITQTRIDLEGTDVFVRTLNHFTSGKIEQLKERTLSLSRESEQLNQLVAAITRDVKTLRRHVGLIFRLRNAIWSTKDNLRGV